MQKIKKINTQYKPLTIKFDHRQTPNRQKFMKAFRSLAQIRRRMITPPRQNQQKRRVMRLRRRTQETAPAPELRRGRRS